MRLKNDTNNFAASFNITPPYQMRVIHSSKLIYPREIYQRGVQRKRVELIAADFNEYVANLHGLQRQRPQGCSADEVLKHIFSAKRHLQAADASCYIIISRYRYF